MRSSIRIEFRRTATLRARYTIGSDLYYAPFVNDGTRPHIIRPKNRQALKFRIGGRTVFAKIVHHPGTKPRPFLDKAMREIAGPKGYRITRG